MHLLEWGVCTWVWLVVYLVMLHPRGMTVHAGLAMDLAAEDEPDAEGFRPSTAFCRALDREDDYNDVDELATGTYKARRPEARPPRNMEASDLSVGPSAANAQLWTMLRQAGVGDFEGLASYLQQRLTACWTAVLCRC